MHQVLLGNFGFRSALKFNIKLLSLNADFFFYYYRQYVQIKVEIALGLKLYVLIFFSCSLDKAEHKPAQKAQVIGYRDCEPALDAEETAVTGLALCFL